MHPAPDAAAEELAPDAGGESGRDGRSLRVASANRSGGEGESERNTAPGRTWWGALFFFVGVFATLLVLVSLFGALEKPAFITAPDLPAVGSPPFLRAVAGTVNAPVRQGGRAELLRNGDAFVPAMLEAVDAAKNSVNWTAYIWEDGKMSDAVLEALERALGRGVEVRVLLDHFGSLGAPEERLAALEQAGARVAEFRPPDVGHLVRYHRRSHRRAIVVDGEVGFIGGAAVKDTWLGDAQDPDHWRDDMVRVNGPLARSLQAAFAQLWTGITGEILSGDAHWPERPEVDRKGERIAEHLSVVSSPSSGSHPLRTVHWMSVAGARKRLWITNPYFVPDAALRAILADRARAGVDVRVLAPSDNTDMTPVRWASQHHYEELLEAGVRIFEYAPTMVHQKALVADGLWSVVGSANLDVRSEELNEENVLAIVDASFAEALEQSFEADLEKSREIQLESWRERSAWQRLRERAAALLAEQL